jgi:uncharacterized damage-inducible protein DinB
MDPAAISEQYATRVQSVLDLVDKVPPDRREEPGMVGKWSLKDLMGHLAYWDYVTRSQLEAEQAGIEPETDDRDEDIVNAEQARARSDWTWEQVMAEVIDNRDARIELHKRPSKHDMTEVGGHWLEHREQIEAWIAANL